MGGSIGPSFPWRSRRIEPVIPRMRGIQYAAASRFYSYCLWNTCMGRGQDYSLSVIAYHLLVRRRPTSPRPDLKTAGRLAERPSRVAAGHREATQALDGRESGGRLEVGTRRCRWWREDDFRGEPALDEIGRASCRERV